MQLRPNSSLALFSPSLRLRFNPATGINASTAALVLGFCLILPSKPLMPDFFIVPCGADPATARPREYAFQPLRKPAHSAFVVLYGQRGEALVYPLPRPRSDSTLSIETETAPCEHPKS